MDWNGIKELAVALSVEKDALHIYFAFAIQVAAAVLLRRPLSSWLPWLAVLAATLFNEFLDLWLGEEATIQQWQIVGARHDIVNTMLLPTLLLLLCRYRTSLFHRAPPKDLPEEQASPPG